MHDQGFSGAQARRAYGSCWHTRDRLAKGIRTYHSTLVVELDDRTLTHLQIVIGAKL
jgi:hypothetical protein